MTFEMMTSFGIDDHLMPAFQNKKIVNPIKHLFLTAVQCFFSKCMVHNQHARFFLSYHNGRLIVSRRFHAQTLYQLCNKKTDAQQQLTKACNDINTAIWNMLFTWMQ